MTTTVAERDESQQINLRLLVATGCRSAYSQKLHRGQERRWRVFVEARRSGAPQGRGYSGDGGARSGDREGHSTPVAVRADSERDS